MESIYNSCIALKGHLTRQAKTARATVELVKNAPNSAGIEALENSLKRITDLKEQIQDRYAVLLGKAVEDADMTDNLTSRTVKVDDFFLAVQEEILTAISNAKTPARAPIAQAPQQAAGGAAAAINQIDWKVQSALAPKALNRDANPTRLRDWSSEMKTFFSISKLTNASIADQHVFFYKGLDLDLKVAIQNEAEIDTPVFAPPDNPNAPSMMGLVLKKFDIAYPLFSRRVDFFKYIQTPKQSFGEFFARVRQLGDEADVAKLRPQDILVYKVICGTSDSKLRDEFFKLKEPTLDDLRNCESEYAMRRRNNRGCEAAQGAPRASSVNAVQNGARPKDNKNRRGNDNKKNSGGKVQLSLEHLRGKCMTCGESRHEAGTKCPMKGLKCNHCKKTGHVARSKSGNIVCALLFSVQGKKQHTTATVIEVAGRSEVAQVSSAVSSPKLQCSFRHSSGTRFNYNVVPDTGATRTMISYDLLKDHGLEKFIDPHGADNVFLQDASGNPMGLAGSIVLQVRRTLSGRKRETSIKMIVSKNMIRECLLSWSALVDLGVISKNFPNDVVATITNGPSSTSASSDSLDKIKSDFKDVLADTLGDACGSMKGEPMEIHFRKDIPVKPLNVHTTRPVPVHYRDMASKLVQELVKSGVLVPVEGASEWCSPGHFVPKPGGKKMRLVTDYRQLNKYVARPTHPFPSAAELIKRVDSSSRWFAKIDAIHGYFQIPLSERSSMYTTFLLPSGRYRYTGAPMGLSSSSDEFCRRSDKAIASLGSWCLKIVDDILVQAETEDQLFSRLRETLECCRKAGIKISNSKLEVGREVMFAGFLVSASGIRPNPEKTAALSDFPVPKNVSELRSFLGLANQLGHFVPDVSQMTVKLRALLKKDNAFVWLPVHQQAFERTIELLTSPMVVFPYDPSLPTQLLTDASRLHGIGFALMQVDPTGKHRLISCGSRSLTDAQRNYATIELECMAIKWGIEKCEYYLRGNQGFSVITDHKPLVGIFNKPLHDLGNERLYRFRERLVDFNFEVSWCPGKSHFVADALSRAPVFPGEEDHDALLSDKEIVCAVRNFPAMNMFLEPSRSKSYQTLVNALKRNENPTKRLKDYATHWSKLSILNLENGDSLVLLNNSRIVVPEEARPELLRRLHLPHSGVNRTVKQACELYFWPRMRNDIHRLIAMCEPCQTHKPSQPQQPIQPIVPSGPMSMVGIDLFCFKGADWIATVDAYSGWAWCARLHDTTTHTVTRYLDSCFLDWGFPQVIRTDGGPQFKSAFDAWCEERSIDHQKSSPYHPQSNGLAEAAVKNLKSVLKKNDEDENPEDWRRALMEWRNTPRSEGDFSPAQLFLGRKLKTSLPMLPTDEGLRHLPFRLPLVEGSNNGTEASPLDLSPRASTEQDEAPLTPPGARALTPTPPGARALTPTPSTARAPTPTSATPKSERPTTPANSDEEDERRIPVYMNHDADIVDWSTDPNINPDIPLRDQLPFIDWYTWGRENIPTDPRTGRRRLSNLRPEKPVEGPPFDLSTPRGRAKKLKYDLLKAQIALAENEAEQNLLAAAQGAPEGLRPLVIGEQVRVQHPKTKLWTETGIIVRKYDHGRSYDIDTGEKVFRRNRIHFRTMWEAPSEAELDRISTRHIPVQPAPTRRSTRQNNRQPVVISLAPSRKGAKSALSSTRTKTNLKPKNLQASAPTIVSSKRSYTRKIWPAASRKSPRSTSVGRVATTNFCGCSNHCTRQNAETRRSSRNSSRCLSF